MFCPGCGSSVPDGAAFCITCGGAVPKMPQSAPAGSPATSWSPAPAPPPPAGPGSWTPSPTTAAPPAVAGPCSKCGARIDWPGGAWYCPACGAALAAGAERPAAPGSQGSKVCRQCNRVGPSTLAVCPHCGAAMRGGGGSGATLAIVAVVVLVGGVMLVALMSAILVPNFIRARASGQFTACKSNLRNVGTALEMYSTDHQGRYPPEVGRLAGDYLKSIPTCPSAGRSTYLQGYVASPAVPGVSHDAYTVVCAGTNHKAVDAAANYPQYNSVQGLIER